MEFLELFRALVSRYLFPDPPASASSRSLPRIPLEFLEIEKTCITLEANECEIYGKGKLVTIGG